MNRIIVGHENLTRSAWDDFVFNHPEGNIFHTSDYFDLCNTAPYSGVVVACLQDDRICGLLVAVIQRNLPSVAGRFTARAIIMGGPLVEDNDIEIASLLLDSYNKQVKKKVLFSQFRNLTDRSQYLQVFKNHGYGYEEHLNILFNLKKSKESLWSEIHTTRRKHINRSSRQGVVTSCLERADPEKLDQCYKMLKKVYRKAGLPLPRFSYFVDAANIFSAKGILKLFIAEAGSVLIGFRMILCYRETIYDWYAAGSDNNLDKYPNDVLPWEVISWGSDHLYERFDFGGAGNPVRSYGVRDYKLKFGGEVVNYGRFTCVHKDLVYRIIMGGLFLYKRISGKK